ncbi:MAG: hypothetical protein B7Z13_15975, partial [Caulobacterales bacterium 32-67-6]
ERQVDAAILRNSLAGEVWTHDTLQPHRWDPLIYQSSVGSALYGLIARDFAPLPQRLASATARMNGFPGLMAQVRASLDPARTPKIHAETVSGQNAGLVSLVDLLLAEAGALDADGQAGLRAAADVAKAAIAEHQTWIDQTLVPQAAGEWRLGAALYDAKLAFALDSPLSRAEVKAAAEEALAQVRAEMYDIARQVLVAADAPPTPPKPTADQEQAAIAAALELVYADRATPETLIETAQAKLDAAIAFVAANPIVTPPTEPVQLVLTPEFQRGVAVAYCDPPGPLDRELPTFYKLSPIPEDWTPEQAESFLREYNNWTLEGLTVHEGTPGHYLQLAISNRHPSVLRWPPGRPPPLPPGQSEIPAAGDHQRHPRHRRPCGGLGRGPRHASDDPRRLPAGAGGGRQMDPGPGLLRPAAHLFRRLAGTLVPAPGSPSQGRRRLRHEGLSRSAAGLRLPAGADLPPTDVRPAGGVRRGGGRA